MKGWKTVAFAGVIGLVTALSDPGLQQWVAANLTWAGPVLGSLVIVLRALTTTPIFNMKKKE